MKTSLFEGGVRGAAAVWSPLFKNQNHLSKELFHITDWLPTFVAAAGQKVLHVFISLQFVSIMNPLKI